MNILIVSATVFEIAPLQQHLEEHFNKIKPFHYKKNHVNIYLLVTGVGLTATAFSLGRMLSEEGQFDLAINLGVAGAFDKTLKIGDVVQVVSEQFGDLGVEEATGQFTDLFEMGLAEKNEAPYADGKMSFEVEGFHFLRKVAGLTVNKVHGTVASIEAIRKKYQPEIESMEGAAFFYACLLSNVKCLQIRAISNYVEPRNRDNWNLPLAIENLNKIAWSTISAIK